MTELPIKLKDCRSSYTAATELLIVEGDSASHSVAIARNPKLQAVLPIQGKPLNPIRASRIKVAENAFFQSIIESIGAGWDGDFDISKCRYERIVLLFDPDADGIHCSMLVLMFFYRWMRPLLDVGRIHLVRAPSFQITFDGAAEPICLDDDLAGVKEVQRLKDEGRTGISKKPFRGLGSMGHAILRHHCVNPQTRKSDVMTRADAEAAIAVFTPLTKRR